MGIYILNLGEGGRERERARERERERTTYRSKASPSYEDTAVVIKEDEGGQEDAYQGGSAGG